MHKNIHTLWKISHGHNELSKKLLEWCYFEEVKQRKSEQEGLTLGEESEPYRWGTGTNITHPTCTHPDNINCNGRCPVHFQQSTSHTCHISLLPKNVLQNHKSSPWNSKNVQTIIVPWANLTKLLLIPTLSPQTLTYMVVTTVTKILYQHFLLDILLSPAS